jgi:hypothetical protein
MTGATGPGGVDPDVAEAARTAILGAVAAAQAAMDGEGARVAWLLRDVEVRQAMPYLVVATLKLAAAVATGANRALGHEPSDVPADALLRAVRDVVLGTTPLVTWDDVMAAINEAQA